MNKYAVSRLYIDQFCSFRFFHFRLLKRISSDKYHMMSVLGRSRVLSSLETLDHDGSMQEIIHRLPPILPANTIPDRCDREGVGGGRSALPKSRISHESNDMEFSPAVSSEGIMAGNSSALYFPEECDPASDSMLEIESDKLPGVFPTEIIHEIFQYFKSEAFANARLTCRTWALIGHQYLFPNGNARLPFCPDISNTLRSIISDKSLSRKIRTIGFRGSLDQSVDRSLLPAELSVRGASCLDLEPEFYDSMLQLKNLQSVELRLESSTGFTTKEQAELYPIMSANMFGFFVKLSTALVSPIVKLKMVSVGWHSHSETAVTLQTAFTNVECFELLQYPSSCPHHRDLPICLQYMTRLTTLIIDFMRNEDCAAELFEICQVNFDHLRRVRFSNVPVMRRSLLSFFERHARLKDVHLGNMTLRSGSWPEVIHEMSQIRPDLEKIRFSGYQSYVSYIAGGNTSYSICSRVLNAYIKEQTWQKVGQRQPPGTVHFSREEQLEELNVRQARQAAGTLESKDICDVCGILKEFCTRYL